MSLVISNAFRLPGGIDTLQTIRQLVSEHGKTTGGDIVTRRMAEIAANAADQNAFGFDEFRSESDAVNPYNYARDCLITADRRKLASLAAGHTEMPMLKNVVEYECVVIPCNGDILMMSWFWQSEWNDLNEAIVAECDGEEFSFWNNTDLPENVEASAWEYRYQRWEEALSQFDWVPAKAGYTLKAINSNIPRPRLDDMIQFFPSPQNRATDIAENIASSEWMNTVNYSTLQVHEFVRWSNSDEARERTVVLAKQIINRLPDLNNIRNEWPEQKPEDWTPPKFIAE